MTTPANLSSVGVMTTARKLDCETCGETTLHFVPLYCVEPDEHGAIAREWSVVECAECGERTEVEHR